LFTPTAMIIGPPSKRCLRSGDVPGGPSAMLRKWHRPPVFDWEIE
jgi:hypothetical protein